MIATTPAAEFNTTLARLKLDALNKLAKALTEADNPIDICRITKVLLSAKPIAPPKSDCERAAAHPNGRATRGKAGATDLQETTDAPDPSRCPPGPSTRPARTGRADHAADGSLDQHGHSDSHLQRQDPAEHGDASRLGHTPRPAEVDEGDDALAQPARRQQRLDALE